MGAWAYCRECGDGDTPIGPPDARETLQGYIECSCGERRWLDDWDKTQLLVEMHEDIAKLKATVAVLTKAVQMIARGAFDP